MTSIVLTAPAKVNLFLKVLGKRRDSYHNILTLFERISLEDEIMISKEASGISLHSDIFITKDPKDNLMYKAARLILDYKKISGGVSICIKKRIPIAAGLGGGSSDAASVLLGINRLYNMRLKKTELMRLGRKLGADVPFFILDKPYAAGSGRGDDLEIMPSKARFWHLLVYPGFKVVTKETYEAFDRANSDVLSRGLTRRQDDVKIRPLEFTLRNDLGEIITAKRPVIANIIRRLANLSDTKAVVSGSGPSVFCLYETRKEAMEAKRRFLRDVPARQRRGWQIFVTETRI